MYKFSLNSKHLSCSSSVSFRNLGQVNTQMLFAIILLHKFLSIMIKTKIIKFVKLLLNRVDLLYYKLIFNKEYDSINLTLQEIVCKSLHINSKNI